MIAESAGPRTDSARLAPVDRLGLHRAAEIEIGVADYGDIAGRLRVENGLSRREQVGSDARFETDNVDRPGAAVVARRTRSDSRDPKLAGRAIGDFIEC